MNARVRWLLLLAAMLLPAAAWAASGVVRNGSFERPQIDGHEQNFPTGSKLGPWKVTRGDVDVLAGRFTAADGLQSLDLNGTGPGTIRQVLMTRSGPAYKLSFALAGNPECDGDPVKRVSVFWDGKPVATLSFDTTGHWHGDLGWEPHAFPVTSSGGRTRLVFQSLSDGACGPAIDAVVATPGR